MNIQFVYWGRLNNDYSCVGGLLSMAKIIILMSTYNGEKYLREQIDSIKGQSLWRDIDIFVRDDGSADKTVDILEEYYRNGDLKYYKGENIGSMRSFHELIRSAEEADYYAFADQDDVWLPKKIERALEYIKKIDKPVVYSSRKTIVNEDLCSMAIDDIVPSLNYTYIMLGNNYASGCTMVFNKMLRDKYLKCFGMETMLYHDSYLWKLGATLGNVYYDNNSYILYRQHGDNTVGYLKTGYKMLLKKISRVMFTGTHKNGCKISKLANVWIVEYKEDIERNKMNLLHYIIMSNKSLKIRYGLLRHMLNSRRYSFDKIEILIKIIVGWI